MMDDCRKNKSTFGTPWHPDYYKFVLRNGDIDPNTWESVNNFSNDSFLENKPAYGGLVKTSHRFKNADEIAVVRNVMGQLVVDTSERDDIYALKEQRDSESTALMIDVLRAYPQIADSQEVQEQLALLDARVPQNIPNRSAVLEGITRDYLISRYKIENPSATSANNMRILAEAGVGRQPFETTRDVVARLTRLASAEEADATTAMDVAEGARRAMEEEAEQLRERMEQAGSGRGSAMGRPRQGRVQRPQQGVGGAIESPQEEIARREINIAIRDAEARAGIDPRTRPFGIRGANLTQLRQYLNSLETRII